MVSSNKKVRSESPQPLLGLFENMVHSLGVEVVVECDCCYMMSRLETDLYKRSLFNTQFLQCLKLVVADYLP